MAEKVTKSTAYPFTKKYEFCFSQSWFGLFKRRFDVSLRYPINESQYVPEYYETDIHSFYHFVRHHASVLDHDGIIF